MLIHQLREGEEVLDNNVIAGVESGKHFH